MGQPVVAFGRHNIYNFLPHVFTVEDESRPRRNSAPSLEQQSPRERSRSDGARFLKAVIDRSFDMRGYSYQAIDRFAPEAVQDACAVLARGLPAHRDVLAA